MPLVRSVRGERLDAARARADAAEERLRSVEAGLAAVRRELEAERAKNAVGWRAGVWPVGRRGATIKHIEASTGASVSILGNLLNSLLFIKQTLLSHICIQLLWLYIYTCIAI